MTISPDDIVQVLLERLDIAPEFPGDVISESDFDGPSASAEVLTFEAAPRTGLSRLASDAAVINFGEERERRLGARTVAGVFHYRPRLRE